MSILLISAVLIISFISNDEYYFCLMKLTSLNNQNRDLRTNNQNRDLMEAKIGGISASIISLSVINVNLSSSVPSSRVYLSLILFQTLVFAKERVKKNRFSICWCEFLSLL